MRMFQKPWSGSQCRPSSTRKSAALRRRRFRGQILGTIPRPSGEVGSVCRTAVRGSKPRQGASLPLKHKWTCVCLVNRWLPVRGRRAAPVMGACPNRVGIHIAHSSSTLLTCRRQGPTLVCPRKGGSARMTCTRPSQLYGPVAQPGARRDGIAEAAGSNPARSTME
jgi:hypothetical protein